MVSSGAESADWSKVKQIIMPTINRHKVLSIAHESLDFGYHKNIPAFVKAFLLA